MGEHLTDRGSVSPVAVTQKQEFPPRRGVKPPGAGSGVTRSALPLQSRSRGGRQAGVEKRLLARVRGLKGIQNTIYIEDLRVLHSAPSKASIRAKILVNKSNFLTVSIEVC